MNKEKIKNKIKNIAMIFSVFMTGFIGSILLIMKRTSEMTTAIIEAQKEITNYAYFFGIKIMEFKSVYSDGAYIIDITENKFYNFIPFITGFVLLFLALVLTGITKKFINKRH